MSLLDFGIQNDFKMTPGKRANIGSSHAYAVGDANGDPKIIVYPIQADDSWKPVPAELRAEGYHDPVKEGTKKGDKVWVKDKGFVPLSEAPAGLTDPADYVADEVKLMGGNSEIATLFNQLRDKVSQALGR
jgi:hypothetical protein